MSENKEKKDFFIDLSTLKKVDKPMNQDILNASDAVGAGHGFVERNIKKRGRQKSPRTGQVHAKVLPIVADQISNEAKIRGVQQGVIIEECWELYRLQKPGKL